ncbi:hypothetical protein [Nodosilinea sp. FACHB-13]|uniref:hypothetical protein n=1 Tax=Cyanophyceae TaxID=3028117 RepID=UPI001682922F|nr:hypothetical protein [Nodosilinea sp. FACHB-13]MBD2109957.1 hypothetical protein [Nodosilinea sp. FACHB-13]
MTQRFLPLLFPAVDHPVSKVSSHLMFDCPRLMRAGFAPLRGGLTAKSLVGDRPLTCPPSRR